MHDYSLNRNSYFGRSKRKANKTNIIIAVLLIFTLIFVFFSSKTNIQTDNNMNKKNSIKTQENNSQKNNLGIYKVLADNIEQIISTAGGTFSVYFYDINKNQEYGYHHQMVLTGASLNKTAILATLYHLAGKNEIDLEKIITLQKEDIQDYGSGSIRYDKPGTIYSIKTLARLMMEKSDNTASYILAQQIIGMDKIQSFIDSLGLTQTSMAENKTSAKDMGILLVKSYKGEITSPALTAEMLNFMEKSDFDDRLPRGLPEGTKIYHKTGDEIGKIHDVGIVDLPGKPYFLGVLTSDMTDEKKAKDIIATISKIVYVEMAKNN
uniref:Serine hydrolase n=1 Tax=candidate division CPR3 bacterium TaxID=2268181 RepID=A0A7C4M023_UNCC3